MEFLFPPDYKLLTAKMIVLASIAECLPHITNYQIGIVRDPKIIASEQQLGSALENLANISPNESELAKLAHGNLSARNELLSSIGDDTKIAPLVAYSLGVTVGNLHQSLLALQQAIFKPVN